VDTHGLIVTFGKHKGERWTRVPVNYLRWCVNEISEDREAHKIAKAELARRGDTMPTDIKISNHAINSASLRIIEKWHEDRKQNEGLYSWLVRICEEALTDQSDCKRDRIVHKGCVLIFAYGNEYPTLKTVKPNRHVYQTRTR